MTADNDTIASGKAEDQLVRSSADAGDGTPSSTAEDAASNARKEDPNLLLARIAVHSKAISKEEVVKVLRAWNASDDGQSFEAFLITGKYLPLETVVKLARARDKYLEQRQDASKADSIVATAEPPGPVEDTQHATTKSTEPVEAAVAPADTAYPAAEVRQAPARTRFQNNGPDLLRYGPDVGLEDILQQAVELNTSDLHVHSGAPLQVRLNGEIRDATTEVLSREESERLVHGVLSESQRSALAENFQIDFAYEIPNIGRFRANAYRQRRGIDAVFRVIKPRPPTLAELGLPGHLESFTRFHQGLVLFTGPAGCGKSSTMAAMINIINEQRADHVLTVEDPIEYVYGSGLSNINQREAGLHTESFAMALRAALREDPDVIVIGELRDLETISLALTAAETGHLVLATLHTSNAMTTVNRLLGVFPPDQQAQVRMMLSESLRVVVSQRLAFKADGSGRAVALEVMVNNLAIGNLIRENRTFQIKSAMQSGKAQGQLLLDASLAKLVKDKVITKEEASRHADEPESFE